VAIVADGASFDALACAVLHPVDVIGGTVLAAATDLVGRADVGSRACSHGNVAVSMSFAVGGNATHFELGTKGIGGGSGAGHGFNAGGVGNGGR